ncbi:MAG: hypothetical protein ABII07_06025 [Patescibacteria group bacterium]|nr:hypothetical protein [Patescibacteria group bacterium]
MKNEPPNFDSPEISEEDRAFEEACALRVEILAELDRIREKIGRGGFREYDRLFHEIFRPEGIDRSTLLSCVVYHGLIASSPPPNLQIDLPGDQNLMAFAKRKLEELKQM